MSWSQLPTGEFTGIDWGRPGATNGFDPYLVWAEADRFAGYKGKKPTWLPVVLELKPGNTVVQLGTGETGVFQAYLPRRKPA